jgi:hypothetical protein
MAMWLAIAKKGLKIIDYSVDEKNKKVSLGLINLRQIKLECIEVLKHAYVHYFTLRESYSAKLLQIQRMYGAPWKSLRILPQKSSNKARCIFITLQNTSNESTL